MLSQLSKALLAATSLAPVLLGYGVLALCDGSSLRKTWFWFLGAAGLTFLAYLLPLLARKKLAAHQMQIKSVKDSDKEILTFLITYLLPLAGKPTLGIGANTPLVIYVFGIIFLSVYHTNAFTFNPLLAIFGYHFFEVVNEAGMTYLLVTRRVVREQSIHLWVIQLSDYVFLEGEEPDK